MTLFFRQASQLFAYRQWLHLLQLENLYLQLKYKDHPISCIFPTSIPWVPYKGRQRNKGQRRAGKRKSRPRYEISKGAIAFALGLGLASAGLLLGWTMGWLCRAAQVSLCAFLIPYGFISYTALHIRQCIQIIGQRVRLRIQICNFFGVPF